MSSDDISVGVEEKPKPPISELLQDVALEPSPQQGFRRYKSSSNEKPYASEIRGTAPRIAWGQAVDTDDRERALASEGVGETILTQTSANNGTMDVLSTTQTITAHVPEENKSALYIAQQSQPSNDENTQDSVKVLRSETAGIFHSPYDTPTVSPDAKQVEPKAEIGAKDGSVKVEVVPGDAIAAELFGWFRSGIGAVSNTLSEWFRQVRNGDHRIVPLMTSSTTDSDGVDTKDENTSAQSDQSAFEITDGGVCKSCRHLMPTGKKHVLYKAAADGHIPCLTACFQDNDLPVAVICELVIHCPNMHSIAFLHKQLLEGTIVEPTHKQCLHYAAMYGLTQVVKSLADEFPDSINERDQQGCTPLHWAAAKDHLECVKELIVNGGDVKAVDGEGRIPLHLVRSVGCAKTLLRSGSSIEAVDAQQWTLLHSVSRWATAELINYLLTFARDKHIALPLDSREAKMGLTALSVAAFHGNKEAVQALISAGASVAIADAYGRLPAVLAALGGHDTLAGTLLRNTVASNARIHEASTSVTSSIKYLPPAFGPGNVEDVDSARLHEDMLDLRGGHKRRLDYRDIVKQHKNLRKYVVSEDSRGESLPICAMCESQQANMVILPCNHACVCDVCAAGLELTEATHAGSSAPAAGVCPVCCHPVWLVVRFDCLHHEAVQKQLDDARSRVVGGSLEPITSEFKAKFKHAAKQLRSKSASPDTSTSFTVSRLVLREPVV